MSKIAITAAPISPLLAERWSPRSFDANHTISDSELTSLLEAARWAPSANNGQPWRFSVATRGTELHTAIVAGLTGWNASWAPAASALIVASAVRENADGAPYKTAHYDLGLAVSQLTIQAQALGLHVHTMGGFTHADIQTSLALDASLEPVVILAVGLGASADALEGALHEREVAPRTRLALDEIVLHGLGH